MPTCLGRCDMSFNNYMSFNDYMSFNNYMSLIAYIYPVSMLGFFLGVPIQSAEIRPQIG